MWLDEADGFAEIFKGYLPFYLLVALPIFIIMSPVKPVAASHEFSVYRMQQYDLHTVPHGKKLKLNKLPFINRKICLSDVWRLFLSPCFLAVYLFSFTLSF